MRAHLLKYHVDVVNVLICHIHLPEELMKTQTEKILAEQRQNMYNAQREAEEKRIQLERTKSQADNQKDLMAATVGVEIAGKRAEQRKSEGEGEAHYISQPARGARRSGSLAKRRALLITSSQRARIPGVPS